MLNLDADEMLATMKQSSCIRLLLNLIQNSKYVKTRQKPDTMVLYNSYQIN